MSFVSLIFFDLLYVLFAGNVLKQRTKKIMPPEKSQDVLCFFVVGPPPPFLAEALGYVQRNLFCFPNFSTLAVYVDDRELDRPYD